MNEKINEMDVLALVDRCMNEINNYRHGEPSNDAYGLELFRRALQECDPFAWEIIQLHFTEMLLQWMRSHPLRNVACNYDSDENYAGEPVGEDLDDGYEVWEVVRSLLTDERQQRVAYLIYHCGLKPREIIQFCSQEFSDIQEIYRLRRSIFERLQRNADYIRWRLDYQLQ